MPAILMDINGDIEDVETHVLEAHVLETNDDSNITSNVKTITEYLLSHKKIPMPHDLPVKLRTDEELPPQTFVPSENVCPLCPGPTPPELNTEIITCKAVVYGIKYIHKGSSVAVKKCPACQNVIRFQEYESGFHNFNNKVFLTMPLCELLLSGLANKTTPGRMLETLTFFNNNTYHHQTIRKAFQHFLALTDFKYEFTCHQCGHNPPIIIADGNWKLAFDIPIGTFKRPEQDSILEEDLEVDITKAWDDLTKALIAEGSLSGTTTNPYKQKLSHSTLAPWMGENTRYGNVLPKTEIKKAMGKKRDTAISKAAQNVNEDTIRELIESKKPLRKDLQDACHALGVSSDGSVTDLIIKLEELLNFRDVYPKLFVKIQKAGENRLGPAKTTPNPAFDQNAVSTFDDLSYAVAEDEKANLKDVLTSLKGWTQPLTSVGPFFPLTMKDLYSVCPLELLEQSSMTMPWLTDDAVNFRIAQLAERHKIASLGTFHFIVWHREWLSHGMKCVMVESSDLNQVGVGWVGIIENK
ncbi:hypothetical protein WMY93_010366 [Mugilogobius chulae]|uniref:HMG domain-containing protein n=1 Tax=Mugilogobius chulae TaxID=88201 RepID=A0AAW0PG28_9GOBI